MYTVCRKSSSRFTSVTPIRIMKEVLNLKYKHLKKKKSGCHWLYMFSGHPNMGGPMQRMTPPRGMVPLGPQVTEHLSVQCFTPECKMFLSI